jgi:hypothetical protein
MSFMRCFTEADSTHVEIAHVPTLSTTLEASAYYLALVLWRAHCTQLD